MDNWYFKERLLLKSAIAGTLLVGTGVYIHFAQPNILFFEFFELGIAASRHANGRAPLILLGILSFGLGVLGYFGAMRKSRCMIRAFSALMAVVVLAEVKGNPGIILCVLYFLTLEQSSTL